MLHIPILRNGRAYESVEKVPIVHHASGEPVAMVSQANSGMIVRDIHRMDDSVLERFSAAELIAICGRAAELFVSGTLPLGDANGPKQSFDDYIRQLSATTGMPVTYCRNNAEKIRKVLAEIETVIAGLTRGLDLTILDRGYGTQPLVRDPLVRESLPAPTSAGIPSRPSHGMLSFFREGRIFGAVLPSNSPGVHSLWAPAIALKTPVVLKPGREEPWTPLRMLEAFAAAGIPREAFGFYPTDHAGAGELLRNVSKSMIFGDASTTRPWQNNPNVEIHGPGFSKIILGDDAAGRWEQYLDVMATSIAANGGRSCINASGVWTPRNGRQIAEALAKRLAKIEALPADDPRAEIAAFANAQMAMGINAMIDAGLRVSGAEDMTEKNRGTPRLVQVAAGAPAGRMGGRGSRRADGVTLGDGAQSPLPLGEGQGEGRPASGRQIAYLLPTIIWIDPHNLDRDTAEIGPPAHPLANREFLFPFASVVECPTERMAEAIGPSLIVTAITEDKRLIQSLMNAENVDRLNIGPIPTFRISWDQPHEGNLFEHLYRQRAFQIEAA